MNTQSNRTQNYFDGNGNNNDFLEYVQSLSPDIISQLSKPESQEVFQVMEKNIIGLLGNLPSQEFGIMVNTSRENLGRLLASAMMSGYFLRNAEQRMNFEKAIENVNSSSHNS